MALARKPAPKLRAAAAKAKQAVLKRPASSKPSTPAASGVGGPNFAAAASKMQTKLRSVANPSKAPQMAKYLRNLFVVLGVATPERRAAVAQEMSFWSARPTREVEGICHALYDLEYRECHQVAVDILLDHRPSPQSMDSALLLAKHLALRNSWWDTVDALSAFVGKVLDYSSDRLKVWDEIDTWIDHPDFWIRRMAIICQRTRHDRTDTKRMFRYCKKCGGEEEFFIAKGIGWALRSHARVDPKAVREFIASTHLQPLSVKEGLRHIGP
mmetsp:Transcript_63576/g.151652  ORF Transcript_63576/g.151652 Transcript_63576/m.151652 type:complete len:270 (-) Transcript_63576:175-984(-)